MGITANHSSVRLAPAWPVGARGAIVNTQLLRFDVVDGGNYRITGTVAIDGNPDIPVYRRVRLYHELSGRLVRETWSNPITGAYAFYDLKNQTYFAISHDHTRVDNAAVADFLTPTLPP